MRPAAIGARALRPAAPCVPGNGRVHDDAARTARPMQLLPAFCKDYRAVARSDGDRLADISREPVIRRGSRPQPRGWETAYGALRC